MPFTSPTTSATPSDASAVSQSSVGGDGYERVVLFAINSRLRDVADQPFLTARSRAIGPNFLGAHLAPLDQIANDDPDASGFFGYQRALKLNKSLFREKGAEILVPESRVRLGDVRQDFVNCFTNPSAKALVRKPRKHQETGASGSEAEAARGQQGSAADAESKEPRGVVSPIQIKNLVETLKGAPKTKGFAFISQQWQMDCIGTIDRSSRIQDIVDAPDGSVQYKYLPSKHFKIFRIDPFHRLATPSTPADLARRMAKLAVELVEASGDGPNFVLTLLGEMLHPAATASERFIPSAIGVPLPIDEDRVSSASSPGQDVLSQPDAILLSESFYLEHMKWGQLSTEQAYFVGEATLGRNLLLEKVMQLESRVRVLVAHRLALTVVPRPDLDRLRAEAVDAKAADAQAGAPGHPPINCQTTLSRLRQAVDGSLDLSRVNDDIAFAFLAFPPPAGGDDTSERDDEDAFLNVRWKELFETFPDRFLPQCSMLSWLASQDRLLLLSARDVSEQALIGERERAKAAALANAQKSNAEKDKQLAEKDVRIAALEAVIAQLQQSRGSS